MTKIDLYLGDCIEGLQQLAESKGDCLDCVITSPPYKDSDGYSEDLILATFGHLLDVMKSSSLLFVNFGHLAEDKMRPFRVAMLIEKCGFDLQETFVWAKNHYRPIQGKRRVNNLTEFVFMFSSGAMPELDRLSIGVPYQDKSNIGRYSDKDLKCAGNLWTIPYETITSREQKLHNDRFPIELPTRCLKLAGVKPDWLVCDPFSGSGTTALACQQLECNFVGWELDQQHWETAHTRLEIDD